MSIAWSRRKYPGNPKRIEEKKGQVFFVVCNVNRLDKEKISRASKENRREKRTGLLCSLQCQSSGGGENILKIQRESKIKQESSSLYFSMSIVWTRRKYPRHPKRIEEKTGQVFFVVCNINRLDEEKISPTSNENRRENRTGPLCFSSFSVYFHKAIYV